MYGNPFRPVLIRAIYADSDTVIVVGDGRGIANDGQPDENSYAWIMGLADGKGHRRHRVLRQHLLQRPLGARPSQVRRGGGKGWGEQVSFDRG